MMQAQLTENVDGSILATLRNNHLNASCPCVATAVSVDGGATFSAVTFDAALLSPVCMTGLLSYKNYVSCMCLNASLPTTADHSPPLLTAGVLLWPWLDQRSRCWRGAAQQRWRAHVAPHPAGDSWRVRIQLHGAGAVACDAGAVVGDVNVTTRVCGGELPDRVFLLSCIV
jgi:hypothetical protein